VKGTGVAHIKRNFKKFYSEDGTWNELAKESDLHNRKFLDEMNYQHCLDKDLIYWS
jgi:hypothetical protein